MENSELIYDLAKKLNLLIKVEKEGKYIGTFRYIDDKLHKLKEDGQNNEVLQQVQAT